MRFFTTLLFPTFRFVPRAHRMGFSLIEIMIVVSIMGISIGGAVVGYRRFNQRQVLISSAKEVIAAMRQAQARATSGVKANAACINLRGYSVTGTVGGGTTPGSYTLTMVCVNPVSGTVSTFPIQTSYLPIPVRFSGAFSLTFYSQFSGQPAGVDPAPFGASQTYDVNLTSTATGTTLTYPIRISRSGSIDDIGLP